MDGGHVRVQIPFAIDGKYSLQIIDLFTLKSLTDFRGGAAEFLIDPDTSSGELRGRTPQLRYIRNNAGVIIPKDPLSLQLLTVYAHIERLQILDEKVGAQGILSYPRLIAINANYQTDKGSLENNALYAGQFDALLLVPYSQEDLPLMANGGVLAHEHFHALFQKLLIQPLGSSYPESTKPTVHSTQPIEQAVSVNSSSEQKVRDKYHATVLRGLNEGLADVWGWIYSGETNFVRQSLPQMKMCRSLEGPLDHIASKAGVQNLLADPCKMGVSYVVGNQLAIAIRGFAPFMAKRLQISLEQVRPVLGKVILKILPELRKKFAALTLSETLAPGDVLLIMAEQIENISAKECFYLANLVTAEDKKDSPIDEKCQALLPAAEAPATAGDQVHP